jgi:hypothetical protein
VLKWRAPRKGFNADSSRGTWVDWRRKLSKSESGGGHQNGKSGMQGSSDERCHKVGWCSFTKVGRLNMTSADGGNRCSVYFRTACGGSHFI